MAGSYFQSLQTILIDIKTKKDNSILNSVSSNSQLSYYNILYILYILSFNENSVLRLVASTQEVKLEMLEDEDAMIRD